MPNAIIAKDKETGAFATISDAWLDRFPGEFEFVRNADDPKTAEEIAAEQEALEAEAQAEAERRQAQLAALKEQTAAAEAPAPAPTKTPARTSDAGSGDRSQF